MGGQQGHLLGQTFCDRHLHAGVEAIARLTRWKQRLDRDHLVIDDAGSGERCRAGQPGIREERLRAVHQAPPLDVDGPTVELQ